MRVRVTLVAAPDYATFAAYCKLEGLLLSQARWIHTALDLRSCHNDTEVRLVTAPGTSFSPMFWDEWVASVHSGRIRSTRLIEVKPRDPG